MNREFTLAKLVHKGLGFVQGKLLRIRQMQQGMELGQVILNGRPAQEQDPRGLHLEEKGIS